MISDNVRTAPPAGVIILDKPEGFTSFDAVAVMRRLLHEKKLGHTGTLDPMATGVLPILIGRGTKCADILPDTDKSYTAGFRLGVSTDTQDSGGKVLKEEYFRQPAEKISAQLEQFRGEIMQVPPMYSAVSVGGRRLYDLARQGIEVERTARKIFIPFLSLTDYDEESGEGTLTVSCSKGTYIRTLIDDIAKSLGLCGGVMTSLRRTRACGFDISEALSLDELRALSESGEIYSRIRPLDKLFSGYRSVKISEAQSRRFMNGGELALDRTGLRGAGDAERIRVYDRASGDFLGVGVTDAASVQLKILKLLKLN